MSNVRSYRMNVRVGNWYEEVYLAEEELNNFLERKERGELAFQRSSFLKENILKQVKLTVSTDGGLRIGDTVMMVNMGGSGRECAAVSINADTSSLTRPPGSLIQAPCGVSAAKSVQPCTRTAFTITSVNGASPGSPLHYGQSFALRTASGFAGGLYLTSDLQTFQRCAKKSHLQDVSLNDDSSFLSWWKIVHFDPQERLEYEGLPVPANFKVLIIHCKTNQALAVLGDQVLRTTYGLEYEVTANTFLDSHKAELDNNHWLIATADPGGEGLLVLCHQKNPAAADECPVMGNGTNISLPMD